MHAYQIAYNTKLKEFCSSLGKIYEKALNTIKNKEERAFVEQSFNKFFDSYAGNDKPFDRKLTNVALKLHEIVKNTEN